MPTPQKANNTFGGWFTERNGGGSAFTASTQVTSNITVYAKWMPSGSSGTDNPFKGTWTGQFIDTVNGESHNTPFTITFADTTFEDTFTLFYGAIVKQKGTYTYTASTVTTETTAVNFIHGDESSGGWVSSGDFFDEFGINLTGTLSNGKLIFDGWGEVTKTN